MTTMAQLGQAGRMSHRTSPAVFRPVRQVCAAVAGSRPRRGRALPARAGGKVEQVTAEELEVAIGGVRASLASTQLPATLLVPVA